jgi:hypothetical protein
MGEGQSLPAFSRVFLLANPWQPSRKHNIDDGFIWQFYHGRSTTLSLIAAIETSPCAACNGGHVAEGSVATSDASSRQRPLRPAQKNL